jgi:hypothetical protein
MERREVESDFTGDEVENGQAHDRRHTSGDSEIGKSGSSPQRMDVSLNFLRFIQRKSLALHARSAHLRDATPADDSVVDSVIMVNSSEARHDTMI